MIAQLTHSRSYSLDINCKSEKRPTLIIKDMNQSTANKFWDESSRNLINT